jgi:hypothetical protein
LRVRRQRGSRPAPGWPGPRPAQAPAPPGAREAGLAGAWLVRPGYRRGRPCPRGPGRRGRHDWQHHAPEMRRSASRAGGVATASVRWLLCPSPRPGCLPLTAAATLVLDGRIRARCDAMYAGTVRVQRELWPLRAVAAALTSGAVPRTCSVRSAMFKSPVWSLVASRKLVSQPASSMRSMRPGAPFRSSGSGRGPGARPSRPR